ncbi:helix-turn-helix domain-containing protein [Brevibacterium sediminis]|uniref:helix-turn-helix domain-containing protein n=1 Tax=Brevibacterium sediminis TaxID=1857024 RepID=UPI00366B4E56
MIQLDELLTAKQVAEKWQCTEQHVNRLRSRGEFPGIPIGGTYRYDPTDLRKYLNRQKGKAA